MFKLDYSRAETLQLSNDAFYYLKDEDEPLDESNLEEAQEVFAMFPDGFIIEDHWQAIKGTDLIEATFVPYTQDTAEYDAYWEMARGVSLQLTYLDNNQIEVWWNNDNIGTRELYGRFNIQTNKKGLKYFTKGPGQSVFFLKRFVKR